MPLALATGLGGAGGGALAEDAGGWVSLQMALTFRALPADPLEVLVPGLQAARVRTAMLAIAAKETVYVRRLRSRLTRDSAFRGRVSWRNASDSDDPSAHH